MRDWPDELTKAALVDALTRGWGFEVGAVDYLPVGAGSYHWSVVVRDGQRWFVTVDELDHGSREDAFGRLDRALTTAIALHDAGGLDFVVAPVRLPSGGPTLRLTPRYAMSVFPMVDGTAGRFGPHLPADRAPMVDMLATLHLTTPTVAATAPGADLRLPGRDGLCRALADVGREWRTGPFAEQARNLLARNADRIGGWLADFDRLVDKVRATTPTWVITHGEPHPGNVLRTAVGLRLVDWDTVQLAPPERDLWLLTADPLNLAAPTPSGADRELLARYTSATGLPVSPAALAQYRLWWTLADIAAFVGDLRRPHGPGEDPSAALTYLASYLPPASD